MLQFIFAPRGSQAITQGGIIVNSRWWGERIQWEVTVTLAGTLPQSKFLDQFQPVPQKKKGR